MSMRKGLLMACLLSTHLLWTMRAQAKTPPAAQTAEAELNTLVNQALRYSPELKMKRSVHEAALAKIPAARALPDPKLIGSIRHVGVNTFTLGTEPMSGMGVMMQQDYPNPGKLNLKESIALHQTLALKEKTRVQERQLKKEVQVLYFKYLENRAALRINQEIQKVLLSIQEAALSYYRVGKVKQGDIWQIKVERSKLAQDALQLDQQHQELLNDLSRLLGRGVLPLKAQSFPPLNTSVREITLAQIRQHPRWKAEEEVLLQTHLSLKLAQSQIDPDYSLAGGLTHRLTLAPIWELRAGMTLPIYREQKIRPLIKSAEAEVRAQRFALQSLEDTLLQSAQGAWIQWVENDRQLRLYKGQLIPETRASFDSTLAAFIAGQSTVPLVLEHLQSLLRYRRDALKKQGQKYLALSELIYLSGENYL